MTITPFTWLLISAAFIVGLASPTLLYALKALGHGFVCVLRRVVLMAGSGVARLLYASFVAVQTMLHRLDPLTFAPAPVGPASPAKPSRLARGSGRQKRRASLGQAYGRLLYHARFSIVGLWLVLLVVAMPLVVRLLGELSTSGDPGLGSPFSQAMVSTQLQQLATHVLAVLQPAHPGALQAMLITLSATLLLLLLFGSVAAAALPLGLVAVALGTALATLSLVALAIQVTIGVSGLVVILILGLAMVFSLVLVRRFRKELGRQITIADATAMSLSTAGAAILFSGLTVVIGFTSLLFLGSPVMTSFGVGGIVSVSVTVGATLTLLPALLSILGQRVNVLPVVPARAVRLHIPRPWRWAYKNLGA